MSHANSWSHATHHPAVVRFDRFELDLANRILRRDGEEVPLSPRVGHLLAVLVERAGDVVTKDELLAEVWNGAHVSDAALIQAISLLRNTLGESAGEPRYVQTLHRRGYRFIAELEAPESELEVPGSSAEAVPETGVTPADRTGDEIPSSPPLAAAPTPRSEHRFPPVLWAAGIALAAVVLLAGGWLLRPEPSRAGPVILSIVPEAGELVPANPTFALRPDGRELIFSVLRPDGEIELVRRSLSGTRTRPIDGGEGGYKPVFGAAGRVIAFSSGGRIARLPAEGGKREVIVEGENVCHASPVDGDTYLLSKCPFGGLWRLALGSEPEMLTEPDRGRSEISHQFPQVLDDGHTVLFTIWRGSPELSAIGQLDLATGTWRVTVERAFHPRYAEGRLFFLRGDALVTGSYDTAEGELSGPVRQIALDVRADVEVGYAAFDVRGETLAYMARQPDSGDEWLMRISAEEVEDAHDFGLPVRQYRFFAVDPGGRRVAFTARGESGIDLWLAELDSGREVRLTTGEMTSRPSWSSDGTTLAYSSNRAGPLNVFVDRLDGTPSQRLWPADVQQLAASWVPNSTDLCFMTTSEASADVWLIDTADAGARPRPLLASDDAETACEISPDGRWVAFTSDASGQHEVYVSPFPDVASERIQLSFGGGLYPAWSPSGGALFWIDRWRRLMRAGRDGDRRPFVFGKPRISLEGKTFHRIRPISDTAFVATVPRNPELLPGGLRVVIGWRHLLATPI